MTCILVLAVVEANSQSNLNGQISTSRGPETPPPVTLSDHVPDFKDTQNDADS